MDKPKCRLCGERHYGICPGNLSKSSKVERIADEVPGVSVAAKIVPAPAVKQPRVVKRGNVVQQSVVKQPVVVKQGVVQHVVKQSAKDRHKITEERKAYLREYMRGWQQRKRAKGKAQ